MQPQRRSARLLLLAALAASACTEQTPPTAVPASMNAAITAVAGTNNQKVKVKTLQLSSNTLRIDGPSFSGNVTIGNSGQAIETNIAVKAEITQGVAWKQVVNTPAQCSGASGDTGKLPTGSCDMTFTAVASNSAPTGVGTLSAGSATFTLRVVQLNPTGDVELASKSVLVNLVATPSMTVTLAPTTLLIGGAAATATIAIQNPANSLQGVLVQGWIVQGAAGSQVRRASGGSLVTCGSSSPGVLPPGTCTMTLPASASNAGPGGLLVAGDATFELDLVRTSAGVSTTLDVKTVAITLTAPQEVTLTDVAIPSTLDFGAANPYTATIQNTGSSRSIVVLQATLTQGTTNRAAGGREVQCGASPSGTLPTGTCSASSVVVPFNAPNAGTGTLIPGPATLEIDLIQGSVTLDKKIIPVTLVMPGPGIIGIALSAQNVLIGEELEYTATLYNPTTETISAAGIQGYLTQGTIVDFGTGGTDLTCAGATQATLPPGVCTVSYTLNTRNIYGTPAWQPGAAMFRLELLTGNTVLDSRSLNIFLNIIQ